MFKKQQQRWPVSSYLVSTSFARLEFLYRFSLGSEIHIGMILVSEQLPINQKSAGSQQQLNDGLDQVSISSTVLNCRSGPWARVPTFSLSRPASVNKRRRFRDSPASPVKDFTQPPSKATYIVTPSPKYGSRRGAWTSDRHQEPLYFPSYSEEAPENYTAGRAKTPGARLHAPLSSQWTDGGCSRGR